MSDPTPSGFHRLEDALSREKRLTEASFALHTTLDLDEVLRLILEAACEGVGADRGTVFVLSDDGTELWSKVLRGEESLEIRLPLGRGIAGQVAESGTTIRLTDAYEDARFDRSWDEKSGYQTRQLLCQPIRSRDGSVVGVFQLLNKRAGLFDESDETYLDALSVHASLALENARLHTSAIEKERQDREILLVQEVQRAYQPEKAALTIEGLTAAGLNILCEDASGDYYDFIPLERGRHAIVVGDVSGHGLKSALVMAQARAFLRAFCSTLHSLDDVVNSLDARLAEDLSGGLFMSLFIAICDPATGDLAWCNAGHPAALLLRAGASELEQLGPTGRILGVLPDPNHTCGTAMVLAPGDQLLLYTDGATEAFDADRKMFGDERLHSLFLASAGAAPADVLNRIRAAVEAWTSSEHLADDLTLVCVRKT